MPDKHRPTVPSGTEEVKPLELCREDRRKLYSLLEANVPQVLEKMSAQISRQDKMLAVLSASNAVLVWKVLGSPAPGEAATAILRLVFP